MANIQAKCTNCDSDFTISDRDQNFYKKVSPTFDGKTFLIPLPHLCPPCREQQRMVWRNERKLYNRVCDFSKTPIISVHAPDKPYPVYSKEVWWSDRWDACSYEQDFDVNKPFFVQFQTLLNSVPRIALYQKENQNCEYTQNTGWSKNCYMLGGANRNQDCYYGNYVNDCRDCVDNSMIKNCELCYECIECEQCYNCYFCKRSKNCQESKFLIDCHNVRNSFGCVNLVNKEFCLFNEQLTPEAYAQRIQAYNLGKVDALNKIKVIISEYEQKFPIRHMTESHCENVSGNDIFHSKDSYCCFDVSKLEDCSYCSWVHAAKDCMDIYAWGMPAELCYFCLEVGSGAYQNLFDVSCDNCKSMYYSFQCYNCTNCFGCSGLKNKSYCIFNKQYSRLEYEKIVARIITHMQNTGEWGQFFPMYLSGLGYNETIAQEFYPLSQEKVLGREGLWYEDRTNTNSHVKTQVCNSIQDFTDLRFDTIYNCTECSKGYRLTKQEIQFYQKCFLALPNRCFTCRHQYRTYQRNPHQLRLTHCSQCQTELQTALRNTTKRPILCQRCFEGQIV
jgi:hypothetical protein